MRTTRNLLFTTLALLATSTIRAQNPNDLLQRNSAADTIQPAATPLLEKKTSEAFQTGLFPRQEPLGLKQVSISGFYRFFGTYSHMKEDYVLNPTIRDTALQHNLFIGDDAQLPTLLINVAGRPSERASWGFDVFAFQYMEGNINPAYSGQVVDSLLPTNQNPLNGIRLAPSLILNLGINLYGSYQTDIGTFNVRAGGIHWHALSDLTLGSFQGYNRFILFERNPWDPVEKDTDSRYKQYFEDGAISQDTRWGNRAFQGVIIDGMQLPGRMSFSALYGKSELNGGFAPTPNMSYGGKVKRDFDDGQFVSLNTFNASTFADSLALQRVGYRIVTAEFRAKLREFRLQAEIGTGRYDSPIHNQGWEEVMSAKLLSPMVADRFQFEVHAFRIDPSVINNVGVFINSSVTEYTVNDIPAGQVGSNAALQPTGSAVVPLGMMTNNRQGVNLNTSFEIGNLHGAVGFGSAAEIIPQSTQISFSHSVNRLTRSRFWRFNFPQNVGPYNRYSVLFRDTYETINLSDDSSGVAVNKKFFNTIETQLKYKARLFNRDLYAFFMGQYASVQRSWSPVVVTTEEAYLRQYSSELEMYYCLNKNINVNTYLGFERAVANYLTDIDEVSRRPRNQQGYGLGLGFDVSLGRNARLYIRHRWFEFEDRSFAVDHFRGEETVIELKTSF